MVDVCQPKRRKVNPSLLSESDLKSLNWIKRRLIENCSSKVAVTAITEIHNNELGFQTSSQTIGRLLKFHFGEKIKKQQDSKKRYHYYGIEVSLVNTETAVATISDVSTSTSSSTTCKPQEVTPSQNKVARRALNPYRSERLEKNETVKALSNLQSLNKFERGLILPNSLYLNSNELSTSEHESEERKCMRGSYGECIKKTYRGMNVAVKMFHEKDVPDDMVRRLVLREAHILLNLHSSSGIPKLIGVVLNEKPYSLVTSYHGMSSVTECSTTVKYLLHQSDKKLSYENWITVIKNIATVLKQMHLSGYIHNDLKSDNVIVSDNLCITIIDFGKSCLATKSKLKYLSPEERLTYKSQYPWVDPSVVEGKCCPSPNSDVYAFGYLVKTIVRMSRIKSKRLADIIIGTMDDCYITRYSLTRVDNILDGFI